MKIAEIKELSAAARNLAASGKSTGPTSLAGKVRSSLNAVRHGLAGQNLLLPGEDRGQYEARMDGVFTALAPADDAQAQIVALVADDLWKLDRLGRIEQGVITGRIEELLRMTQAAEESGRTARALVALGTVLHRWDAPPVATVKDIEFTRRLDAMIEATEVVLHAAPDLVRAEVDHLNQLLALLQGVDRDAVLPAELAAQAFSVARRVMATLMKKGDLEEAREAELRRAIATIALPDEGELKKLARYRKLLEEGLQRRLQALEQLRKLAVASPATAEASEKAREFRVKLRVVA
ncbi:MAG: hypothetical protein AMXMBFR34_28860 [Myxococcaceae bacterium]